MKSNTIIDMKKDKRGVYQPIGVVEVKSENNINDIPATNLKEFIDGINHVFGIVRRF